MPLLSLATTGRSVLSLARSATKALKTVQSLADGAARFDRISAAFHSGTAAPQSLVSRCFLSAAGDRSLFKKAVRAFGGALEVSQGVGRLRKWARTLLTGTRCDPVVTSNKHHHFPARCNRGIAFQIRN